MSEQYTREWWRERLHLIEAFCEGAPIWFCGCRLTPDSAPRFNGEVSDYSMKKPEPKLRPWKPEEVPVDCWIRTKGCGKGMWRILVIQPNGIVTAHGSADRINPLQLASYEFALDAFEHSTDGGRTWAPCGVLESQV